MRKQRFEREAKTISSLNHPNICTLHDVGSQDGIDYLVMECVEGETLASALGKRAAAAGTSAEVRGANRGCAGQSASQRGGASGSEAGEHHADGDRGEAAGFWLGQACRFAVGGKPRLTAAVTADHSRDARRHDRRHVSIHVAGAGGRQRSWTVAATSFLWAQCCTKWSPAKRAFQGKSQLSVASAILEKEPAPISTIKPMTPPALGSCR